MNLFILTITTCISFVSAFTLFGKSNDIDDNNCNEEEDTNSFY